MTVAVGEIISANLGKFFELSFSDGEVTVARVVSVDATSGEFVYEMSSTNEPKRYQNPLNAYSAGFNDLVAATLLDSE